MNKKGMSKKRQYRLTLVGITSVVTVWVAALALLFSQPGVQSNGNLLPTLASGLQGVALLPDTGASVKPMSPTLLPTSLPVELPPGSQADTTLISNPVAATAPNQPTLINIPDEPVPNSLVIRFKPEMSQSERLDYITSLGGQIVQEIKPLHTVIISLPTNAAASIQSQSVEPGVLENEPDFYAGALYSPNDSLAAGQWGLDVVKAPQAWDLLPASTPSITIAVIDSGICANHADLQGRIASNGWDFIDNDSTAQDEFGHGCAVSGIIAANSNNNLGIAGVAPNATVLPLRVLDATGIGRYSNVAAAIVYAVDNGAGAINLSLGGPNPSAVLQDAINYAEANGVTVIAAAGNNGLEQVFYPAAYPSVVAVGSVSQNLQRSPFSNYGTGIDLYAPGDGIMTTSLDGSFQNYSGTSVAAPYVTGVWALRQAMGKNLIQDGGIVSALYASDAPVPTEEPASELCLLSDTQAAETAYFGLVAQNAAQPGSVSADQLEAARAAYLGLAEQCANVLYDDNMTIDGGGISPFAGEISPLFQIFGTKWKQAGADTTSPQIGAAFNQGQPPAEAGGIIRFSFMPSNVSLASKEVENGGGSNALVTAISDLPNNAQCDLQGRIRQAFTAWGSVANVQFVEIAETGLIPFGAAGVIGDMRIGAQIIDGMKGELGHAYFPPPDPEIATSTRSGDIFLDRSEVWGCAPSAEGVTPRVLDIGLVVLHELGHALGMQHERAAGVLALMNPTYNTALLTDAAGGNLLLTTALKNDDQSGMRAIYGGIGVSAPSLRPVSGTESDNTPTFTWIDTVAGGADYFEVEIYLNNNEQPGDLIFDGTTTGGTGSTDKSFTVPNILQSLPYLWRIRAFDQGAYGVWSNYAPFEITVGIPAPLSPTAGQVLTSGDVRFLWGAVGNTNSYLLQIANQAEFTPESLIVDQTVTGTNFTAPTLPDDNYYWRVQSGNNPFSLVNSFKVDSAARVVDLSPGAANASPADGAHFTGAGANENITVQWDALEDVSEYQLQLDTSENFVGLLFLDKLFLDKLFLDKLFLDKLFLDKLFLDKLFLDKLFLDKLFLDKLFLDKLFLDKLFLDKLFLDKLFLDKIEYTGGATASFTFDTLPLSEGVHYWRVRPRLADGSFGPWSESRSFDVRTQATKVVINEIKLSDPSWIEFHNTGREVADMGGWQFFAYGPSGETQLLYTFPAGFTMQPGAYSVLYEGTGTDTDRALYTNGNQIDWPLTAEGEAVTGETISGSDTLNGFGTIVTVPGLTSTNSGATAQIISLPLHPVVEPVATLVGQGASILGLGDVTAQTAFNIAIGDTVSNGVPGAGAGNIEFPESNDSYTFTATAGQVVLFESLGSSTGAIRWALRDPSNTVIFDVSTSANGGEHTLAAAGNYVVRVYSNSAATGTYSFNLVPVSEAPQTGGEFTVNNTTDADDGVCGVLDCSLREAINAANADVNPNLIEFDLPGAAPYTIQPLLALPTITDSLNLNGQSEPDFVSTPIIEIDGSLAGDVDGLTFSGNDNTIQGLVINRFGTTTRGYGIYLNFSDNNAIHNNYIGTDVTGTLDRGNHLAGVIINNSSDNLIGGSTDGSIPVRNVISGNGSENSADRHGVLILNSSSTGNIVAGNYIGVDVTGTQPLGNSRSGVALVNTPTDNLIGTNGITGAANVISANSESGVYIQVAYNNTIAGNYIGTDYLGVAGAGLGNGLDGVSIDASSNNIIGGATPPTQNVIGGNAFSGVAVYDATSSNNSILGNSIFDNGGLGIDIIPVGYTSDGVTINDFLDADSGPNGRQNFPNMSAAVKEGATINLVGTFTSTPNSTFTIQFLNSPTCDPTGNGEGKTSLGQISPVETDGDGQYSFDIDFPDTGIPLGSFITITATGNSGTSEFSPCIQVTGVSDTAQTGPTFTVNTTNATDDDVCGIIDCSLIEAINASNAQAGANTINFNVTTPATIMLSAALPTISTAITIDGVDAADVIINGNDIARIFSVNSTGIFSLLNVTVANGLATDLDGGGGLYNAGGTVTVTNALFDSNATGITQYGGAIFNQAGTLTVNSSTFTNNSADYGGGAIFNWKGSTTITNSIFSGGNSAAVGAALHNYSPDGVVATMTVSGGEIADNNASAEPGQGGAIMSEGTDGATQLTVSGTNIHDNSGYQAGGIWVHRGTATLTNINLHDNSATTGGGLYVSASSNVTISGGTVSGNITSGEGGGLWSSGTVNVTNTTFSDNTGGTGGAAANYGTMTVTTSTFSGNETTVGQGGAIANFNTFTAHQSTFNDNVSILNGGVLDNAAFGTATASATFTNSTLNNNTANGVGGALLNYADVGATAILTVRNSTISGNISTVGYGGGIANFGGGGTETVTVEFSTFVSNEAADSANLRNMPDKTFNVKNSITALPVGGTNCGGLMSSAGDNFTDDSSCNGFTQVTAGALNLQPLANNGGLTQTIALGAGSIAIDSVTDCTVIGGSPMMDADQRGSARPQGPLCDAGAYEAGILPTPTPTYTPSSTPMATNTPYLTPTFPPPGDLTVTTTQMIQDGLDGRCSLPEAIIAANSATQSGGVAGECVPSEGTNTITLAASQIYTLTQVDNTTPLALSSGPNGLPIISSTIALVMNGSTIRRATDAVEDFRILAVSDAANLTINGGGGTISGGKLSAGGLGSAVYNEGTTSINNATIENNQSGSGALASYGTLSITSATLRNNQALGYGGAVYSLGPLTLINNVFENNQAAIDGGAIFNSTTATVVDSSFIDNHAEGRAGAIINAGSMTISNATFSGNSSDAASTILNLSSSLSILHTTIADNITTDNDHGAVENGDGTLTLTNSIIANNNGGDNCVGTITDGSGNVQYPDESCVFYYDTGNPLLGELTNAGNTYFYPLLTGSLALDHGAAIYCTANDIRGVARPAGDCDSGSYEGSIPLTGDLTVTTTQPLSNPSDGLCSLVEAIDAANSGTNSGNAPGECVPNSSGDDTITLGAGLTYTLAVVDNSANGDSGLPVIISPITINGNGSTITRNSEAQFRIFYVAAEGDLTLNNATLSNGVGDLGGAIFADGSLTLNFVSIANNAGASGAGLFLNGPTTINNSAIVGNSTHVNDGGGIFVDGSLTISNSTIAGNSAAQFGGGIVTSARPGANPNVTIINSTIANNIANTSFNAGDGGGIRVFGGGNVTIYNTIIANNSMNLDGGGSQTANCFGNVNAGSAFGTNLQWPDVTCTDTILTADPLLGPLTGSPAYLPLSTGSPAIDAADPAFCPAIDQRGIPRVAATCDIGAVELTEAPALVPGTTGGAAALVSPLTTDFVRFGDTTLGPANASEWTGDNVAVTDSSNNNVTIGRDPSSSDTNHVTDWATQRPTEGGQNFTNVLINEIYTGSNDYVELYNPRAETADISNWELKLYDGSDQLIAAPGATYTVRFAAGTLLRPGQFLVVGEQNPGSGSDFIQIATIDWDDANASGAVTLTNGLTPIDFVRFGSSQANQLLVEPPGGTIFTGVVQSPLPGESIGRSSISEDINNSSDWYSQVRSAGLVNTAITPPANDAFTGATTIDALPFRDTGDTTNASAVNDPLISCGASVGHTIWYKYTPTTSQTIRLQTDGSDFDTVLAVYTLNAGAPVQIAGLCSQRDQENNVQPGSRLSLTASAGTTYYILIGGQLNVSGEYIFSVNAPINDDVNNASLIGSLPFRTFDPGTLVSTINTTAATLLEGEPIPTCAPSAGRSVWYRYDATNATKLRLRTAGTQFDTVITAYTGTPENLVEVICNNDDASDTTSDLGFTPVPGTTYYFQVAGNSDQGGDLLFEVSVYPAPDNDLIGAAFSVTPDGDGTFSVTTPDGTTAAPFEQDTTGATNTDDPVAAQQCSLNPGATVWYSYTAATSETVVFQTFNSEYDTSLSIWTGDLLLPASLTQLGCNDDVGVNKNSRLTLGISAGSVVADVQVAIGTTYYIGVSGYFGETGDLVFNAFTPQTTPPENDRVTTPYDISFNAEDGTYSVIGSPANENTPFVQDTTGAFPALVIPQVPPAGWLSEAGLTVPTPTCGDDVGYTVWYRYAAPERQQIVFDAVGSDFDTVIIAYVLQGEQLVEVGCNDDFEGRAQSRLTLNTDAGVTLYLAFGGFKRDRGNLGLVISQSIAVTSFTLVDAADGSALVDPLPDGAVIPASELPDTISIRANTDPEEIGSVKFELSGAAVLTSTDNEAPYALNGSNPDDSYIPWVYTPGTYTLKATPYAGNNGLGKTGTPLTITFTISDSDNLPPVVSASADPITITLPVNSVNLSATVTDDGLPAPSTLTYNWTAVNPPAPVTFGTPTALNTSATFTAAGTYTLRFTASDGQLSSSADVVVTVLPVVGNQAPVADAGEDQSKIATRPTLKASVNLDGSGSSDSDGDIESYIWTENNIQIASGTEATVDLAIGTHIITLTVTDDDLAQATDTVEIIVAAPANSAPDANAGDDQFVTDTDKNGAELITLDGSSSTDADGNDTILTYAWTENGAPLTTGKTAQVSLSVGTHTITLTVTDDLGLQDSDDVTIEIVAPAVVAPTANAGTDQVVTDANGDTVEPVTLDGSDSIDDGSIISYSWTEIIGGIPTVIATGVNPTINLNVGTHIITLTVTDDENATGTDTVMVKVNVPPSANAGLDQTISVGSNNVALNGSLSSDSDGTIISYSWSENGVAFSNMVAPPALTKAAGTYTFVLTVTDNNFATDTDDVVITVIAQNQAPVVSASANPTSITLPTNSVNLSATATDDGLPAPSTLTYNWTAVNPPATVTFGTANALNTSATFTAAGSYTLRFSAADGQLTGTADVIVTVLPQNTGPITVDDQIELSSDDVNEDGSTYDARNAQLWFGSGQSVSKSFMGLRFNNLEIPKGAVITEAYIEVYTATAQWINMRILIGAEAVDDSATFSSATRPSTRAFTTARLDYQSNTPWPAATWNDIGDVKAVVQEIVNRPGWLPGNSLSILIKGLGSQWGRKFVTSYDGNPAYAPRLVVTYAGGPPPSNNPPDVNVNAPSVTTNEGLLASISGTVSDPDNNPVTLVASLGTVVKTGNTWSWSYTPADGPLNQIVTINAADNRGGSDSVTFNLLVNNVVPTASFNASPLSTYPNNPVTVTFSNPVDVAADLTGLTYSIDCGNGVIQSGTSATCTYGAEGTYTILGRITDKDSGYSDYQAVITVSSTPTAPTTITPQVNGSSDDVNENGASFQVNNSTVWVGTEGNASQSYTGLRFNNLGIPAGATITEAYLEFYVSNSQWIGVDVLIAGEAADNSATFSNGSRPSGRPVTTNRIEHHSNVSWAANSWNTLTGNLSGVIQEIVSRPGWQSGNSLSLILKGMGSKFGRKFVTSYDGNPAFAPRLVIKYSVPSVPLAPPAPLTVPPVAAFNSDVSSGVAPLAVIFSSQSTGDIISYSWNFGDGSSSTEVNPSYVYSGEGVFTVTLTVTGLDGTSSTAQVVINVAAPAVIQIAPPPPVEEATPPPTEEASAAATELPPEATAAP